jgi:acyl-CoA thioesterase YciA
VGAVVSCYTEVLSVGRSSIQVQVEVWSRMTGAVGQPGSHNKVTEGTFVFVAIDENGRTRAVPAS